MFFCTYFRFVFLVSFQIIIKSIKVDKILWRWAPEFNRIPFSLFLLQTREKRRKMQKLDHSTFSWWIKRMNGFRMERWVKTLQWSSLLISVSLCGMPWRLILCWWNPTSRRPEIQLEFSESFIWWAIFDMAHQILYLLLWKLSKLRLNSERKFYWTP